jgi:hypothetical protein
MVDDPSHVRLLRIMALPSIILIPPPESPLVESIARKPYHTVDSYAHCHRNAELKCAEVTYEELAERLTEHGFKETKASVANKLSRATMSAHFFLASLAAIGREGVRLDDV